MDFATLKAQLEQGREITATVEGASFRIRVPTDYAWRVALQAHMNDEGRVQEAAAFRAVLERAIVGWSDVTGEHFGLDGTEPVPFSPEARAGLMEERPDLAQLLIIEIAKARSARRKHAEDAEKN